MPYYRLMRLLSFIILVLCTPILVAQEAPLQQESSDSTIVDTIVIRATQEKIKSIPRGVKLTNPVISFKQTKPLIKPFYRFSIPSFWEKENSLTMNLSEVAFVNWNAGGDNSISALGRARFVRNYKFRYIQWQNELDLRFGWNAQEGRKWRKTEDAIRLSSTFSYRKDTLTNWYYTSRANFQTQFADGYKYPDRSTPISRFMAPGYLFLGAGASYISAGGKFNLYIAPLTHKTTFVLDQELADKGAFGVEKAQRDENDVIVRDGRNHFAEFGFLITNTWDTKLYKNMGLIHRLSFYTDYLTDFGNVDIDWELNVNFKVNDFVKASIGTHILYDDDILFDELLAADGAVIDPGEPRIQFKQTLAIGVVYTF